MPNITITDQQAAALARGENITIEGSKPDIDWNLSLIGNGRSRQTYHTTNLRSPEGDHRAAAQKWTQQATHGSDAVRNAIRTAGGGLIAVCPRSDADGKPYRLATARTHYFRVDAKGNVAETI